jgi:septal ring factor EnvC (AmiA/AmiB activator)
MTSRSTIRTRWIAGVCAALIVVAAAFVLLSRSTTAAGASLDQLNSELGTQQARQHTLATSLGSLARVISSLDAQISLVEAREAAVQAELDHDRAQLLATRSTLAREQAEIVRLRAQLARARLRLSRQLVSSYENARPDLVTVVVESHGFAELLDRLTYLRDAERQQQSLITVTRRAKDQADAAARRLAKLEAVQQQVTQQALVHERALIGMNALLHARQGALARAQAAQQAALAASRAKGRQLRAAIARIEAQQAAAARAAASAGVPTPVGQSFGPSGGWAIPDAIVLCESGGQNLTPNSAGASGYYQILPSTWKLFGGAGPAAYLAGKSEQDAVAARIWNGGVGASNWVCAGLVGVH